MDLERDKLIQRVDQVALPVELGSAEGNPLVVHQLLRKVTAKRYVYRGKYGSKDVIVKCFFAGKVREARREIEGWERLQAAEVRTAALLWHHLAVDFAIIIYDFVPGDSIGTIYRRNELSAVDSTAWFLQLFDTLIQLHKSGLVQSDLHLDNFILSGDGVVAIDVATIRPEKKLSVLIENLTLLVAQFYERNVASLESLINRYQQACGIEDIECIEPLTFAAQLKQTRERRIYKMLSKSLRECTQYQVVDHGVFSGMCSRQYASVVGDMLNRDIDRLVDTGQALKQGNSATVAMVVVADKRYVVKRYNQKNWVVALKRQFKDSRAKKSWLAGNWLRSLGICTPRPVGYLEKHQGFIKREAYFIAEYVAGVDLSSQLDVNDSSSTYLSDLSYIFQMMRYFRFTHGDLKASNLLVYDGHLWLIDLDAMQINMSVAKFKRQYGKDQQRLLKNWQAEPMKSQFVQSIIDIGV